MEKTLQSVCDMNSRLRYRAKWNEVYLQYFISDDTLCKEEGRSAGTASFQTAVWEGFLIQPNHLLY